MLETATEHGGAIGNALEFRKNRVEISVHHCQSPISPTVWLVNPNPTLRGGLGLASPATNAICLIRYVTSSCAVQSQGLRWGEWSRWRANGMAFMALMAPDGPFTRLICIRSCSSRCFIFQRIAPEGTEDVDTPTTTLRAGFRACS